MEKRTRNQGHIRGHIHGSLVKVEMDLVESSNYQMCIKSPNLGDGVPAISI